ncbi:MAG: cyclic pyranopterin monophosphate synthase MoaC [Parvularculaceae bacterium]
MAEDLTHFDEAGRPRMVDVSDKPETARVAIATGRVRMKPETLSAARRGAKKGDVIRIAELAGVMGAKRTAGLVPLCHPLPLASVTVEISAEDDPPSLAVRAAVKTTGKTGVEMEALTAVSVACLTIYDMLKAVDRSMTIETISLAEKRGGKSGDYVRARDAE